MIAAFHAMPLQGLAGGLMIGLADGDVPRRRAWAFALAAGLLFGAGLAVSGMIDPARVRAFLEMWGRRRDSTRAFVMVGAIAPMAAAWRIARARAIRPLPALVFKGAMAFGIAAHRLFRPFSAATGAPTEHAR